MGKQKKVTNLAVLYSRNLILVNKTEQDRGVYNSNIAEIFRLFTHIIGNSSGISWFKRQRRCKIGSNPLDYMWVNGCDTSIF